MKNKCALILLILLSLGIIAATVACSPAVEIASIAISEKSGDFKTEYLVGEELNIDGIALTVTRTDGEVYDVYATDIRQDLRILNFSTEKPTDRLSVVLEYKGVSTSYDIVVKTVEAGTVRYTVSFDSMGGSEVKSQSVIEYGRAAEPETPVREGYRFIGWYTENTFNNQFNFATAQITADTVLYARWARLYTISFYSDDLTTLITTREVEAGGTLSDIPTVPARDGYDASWSRTVFTNINQDVTVYAQYVRQTFTVTFSYRDEDGRTLREVGRIENVPYGTDLIATQSDRIDAFTAAVPEIVGNRRFTGSWDSTSASALRYVTADIYAEAAFNTISYTVVYYWNYPDGTGETGAVYGDSVQVTYNTPIRTAPADPSLDGYRFDGWFRQSGARDKWDFTNDLVTADTALYAGWTKLYKVSRYVPSSIIIPEEGADKVIHNGTEYWLYSVVSVPKGGSDTPGNVPYVEGYGGVWYDVSGTPATQASLTDVNSDISLYAGYEKNVYTVSFYAFDRTTVVATQSVAYMEYASVPSVVPSRTGYSFAGWDYDFDTAITSNTNVYPTYTANVYIVNFYETDSDSSFTEQTVTYGTNPILYEPSAGTDYRFDGWYTERGGAAEWSGETLLTAETLVEKGVLNSIDEFDAYQPSATVLHLYANWIRQYSVIFLDDAGSNIETLRVDAGSILTEDAAPAIEERAGYTGAWYIANEDNTATDQTYSFGVQMTGTLRLRIVYTINVYNVSFRVDFVNNSGITSQSVFIADPSDPDSDYIVKVEYNSTISLTSPGFELPGRDSVAGLIISYGGYSSGEVSLAGFAWTDTGIVNAPITADTVAVATCRLNRFTVTWYADEQATEPLYSTEADFHDSVRLPQDVASPERQGYTFTGFRAIPEGASATDVVSDMSFVPVFTINSYTLKFIGEGNVEYPQYDYEGNSLSLPVNYDYGTVIGFTSGIAGYRESVSAVTEEGVDFLGWRKDAQGTRIYYDPATGEWYKAGGVGEDVYTASYLVVGEGADYLVTCDAGEIANLIRTNTWSNIAERLYFVENGWYTVNSSGQYVLVGEGSGALKPAGVFYVLSGDTTFYAVTEATRYTVSFVTNIDGYVIDPVTVVHNSAVAAPSAAWENMVFLDWYVDPAFVTRYDFSTPVTSDLVLYAAWEAVAEGTEGVEYALNENRTEAYVAGYTGTATEVTVANYYMGVPVTQIGTEAFADTAIVSVTLPDTIISFGPGAFENTALTEITIPQRVGTIPDNCFRDCEMLETVRFREGAELSVIGSYAFSGCLSLKLNNLYVVDAAGSVTATDDVSFPSSLTEIREGAFMGALSLRRVFLPASLQRLGDRAFFEASELMYAVFDRSEPAVLGTEVFYNSGLSYLNLRIYVPEVSRYVAGGTNWTALSDKLVSKYSMAIAPDGGIWSYAIDSSMSDSVILLQYLGDERTGSVFDVTVPNTVTVMTQSGTPASEAGKTYTVVGLGSNVFSSIIDSVEFGSTLSIEADTFYSASILENLTIVRDLYSGYTVSGAALTQAYVTSDSLYKLTLVNPNVTASGIFGGQLPSKITEVEVYGTSSFGLPDYMFADQTFITRVHVGEYVESVGTEAFAGMTALRELYFDSPTYLIAIETSAFSGDISLSEVQTYDGSAFADGIPGAVQTIGNGAFDGVPWVDAYVDSDGFTMLGAGILYSYTGTASVVWVPENAIAVSPNAFEYNSSVRQVVLPEGVKTIGEYAFANAVNLESVYLTGSGAVIGEYAFMNSSKFAVLVVAGSATVPENALTGTLNDSGEFSLYAESSVSGVKSPIAVSNVGYDEASGWVYAYYSNAIALLKYMSVPEESGAVITPATVSGTAVSRIGDYAFTRSTAAIEVDTALVPIGNNPFGGLTSATEITLNVNSRGNEDPQASLRSGTGADNLIYRLVSATAGDVSLTINTPVGVAAVFGLNSGADLPQNLKSIYIDISDAVSIPDSFLENAGSVSGIFVRSGQDVYALETVEAENALEGVSIGSAAFRGTGWMNAQDSEFVFIGGTLIEVRSAESVVRINARATSINGYAFSDSVAETVYIPASVVQISSDAFNGAEKLIRLLFNDREGAEPELTGGNVLGGVDNITIFYSGTGNYASWGTGVGNVVALSTVYDYETEVSLTGDVRTVAHYLISTSGVLYMYRLYTESADGTYIGEVTDVDIPAEVEVSAGGNIQTAVVKSLSGAVLTGSVTSVGLRYGITAEASALSNLSELSVLRVLDVTPDARKLSAATLRSVIDVHSVHVIEYNGAVTMNELLDGNLGAMSVVTSVVIEEGTVETVDELLLGWDHISSVSFPASIRKVGVNSLENTVWYRSYSSTRYGNSNIMLGGVLYYKYDPSGTGGSTDVVIPADAIVVNTAAFANATIDNGDYKYSSMGLSVTQIRFEAGSRAESILDYAFAYCQYLSSVSLPESVTYVSETAFEGTQITATDGALILNSSVGGKILIRYTGEASSYVVPFDVRTIAAGAFEGNTFLTQVEVEDGSLLNSIGENAFKDCLNLTTVGSRLRTLSNLTEIGAGAFDGTAWLDSAAQDVTFGNETAGYIFYKKVTPPLDGTWSLPDNVKSIVEGALEGMTGAGKITGIELPKAPLVSPAELSDMLSDPLITSLTVYGDTPISDMTGRVLDNVTSVQIFALKEADSIADGFIKGWSNVSAVTIPSTVKRIGAGAFDGTAWLEARISQATTGYVLASDPGILIKYVGSSASVTLPGYFKGIAADAFAGNGNITAVDLSGTGVTEIPGGAFKDCTSLTEVRLPAGIVSIGAGAFDNTAEGFAVTFTATDPSSLTVASGVFDSVSEIRVPAEATEKYRELLPENLDKIVGV